MKYWVGILFIIGFISCRETKKNEQSESQSSKFQIDSAQIYYTTEWLSNNVIDTLIAPDSTIKQFFLINRPSRKFDDIDFIKKFLPNIVTITDSNSINQLKDCFTYIKPSEMMTATDCGLPIYRDIIILYAEHKKVAQIKICFSCNDISVYPNEFNKRININDTTIQRLENYFNSNIHKIKMF